MDLDKYQELTGITVPTSKQTLVTAQIRHSKRILERMLGFSLDDGANDTNQYTESGKTVQECPCPDTDLSLNDPDPVVFAYRLFPYNKKDKYFSIDPASAVHAVKLVKDNVTYRTLTTDEYRLHYKNGFIKFIEDCECCFCSCEQLECFCTQLAVDATWLWDSSDDMPEELLDVWAEMTTYYSDQKRDIKQQTLGPHSYTKFDNQTPESKPHNVSVIKKYAGPLGGVRKTITV